MLKKNVRRVLIVSTYISILIIFIIGIFFIERSISNSPFSSDREYIYVSKGILDRNIPVGGNKKVIINTDHNTYDTRIAGTINDKIITIDGKSIHIKDIKEIIEK